MQRLPAFFLLVWGCPLLLLGQSTWNDHCVPPAAQAWLESQPDEWLGVWLLLADRVHVTALDQGFYEQQLTVAQRVPQLLNRLQQKAAQTQSPLLNLLRQHPEVEPGSIRPVWITNAIYCRVRLAGLQTLSHHPDLEQIEPDIPSQTFDIESTTEAYLKPNGHEFHHDSTRATFLWGLGYTGYGQSVLIIDSGVDGSHPSLAPAFRGNYVDISQAWFDPSGNTSFPNDCSGHGTHVAGITVGLDPAAADTIGAAPGATWMGAPALRGGNCTGPQFTIEALQWALNPDGDIHTTDDMPAVINNSYGTAYDNVPVGFCTGVWKESLDALEAAGIAMVFAAGNEGNSGASTISGQASLNTNLVNSFSVGMIYSNNTVVWLSSLGPSACGDTGALNIKPEVSAYGAAIRSSVPGGGYAFQTGTSMASPVVAGGLLLLKEAFPYLTGYELKLALYLTARDLGPTGEDNVYGRGVIDLAAAYQYLLDAGHIPVTVSQDNDAKLLPILNLTDEYCEPLVQPVIQVENQGTVPFTEMLISYSYRNGPTDTLLWTGNLAVGGSEIIPLPNAFLPSGGYELAVNVIRVNQAADYHALDNLARFSFLVRADELTALPSDTVCQGEQGLLSVLAAGTGDVVWYESVNGGEPIATGSAWLSPPLQQDTTLFATLIHQRTVGKLDPLKGNGFFDDGNDLALIFDVETPFILRSVLTRSQRDGSRLIELRDAGGSVIASKAVQINLGNRVVPLDFAVPAGKNMQLTLSGAGSLYVNDAGVNYPYGLPGVVSIKTSNAAEPKQVYPYFFDWQIEYEGVCQRIPVSARVKAGSSQAAFTADITKLNLPDTATVQFTDQSLSPVKWRWNFGDGDTSQQQNPLHTYFYTGTYLVGLSVTSADGCAAATSLTIEAGGISTRIPDPVERSALEIYPNPAQEYLWVELYAAPTQRYRLELLDLQGKLIHRETRRFIGGKRERLEIADLPAGVYLLRLQNQDQRYTRKFVKY